MNFVLVYTTSSGTQTVELNQPTLMLGTLPSNQIVLSGSDIEPIHGLVETLDDGSWRVTDLGSDQGIVVNGQKIDVEKVLTPGDLIKIGNVELTFKVEDKIPSPPVGVPAPPPVEHTAAPSAPKPVSSPEAVKERGEKLFSPREAKPAGDVLEVVAYWGDTVLEVEHYEANKGDKSKARIGRPPEDDFIAAGPKDVKNYALAKATESGYKVKLIDGMKGRLRKAGKVEKVAEGKYSLSRRDIAHVKYGPISYFMLYVRPPALNLPKSSPRDPLFLGLMNAGIVLFFILAGILYTGDPNKLKDEKKDEAWEVLAVNREPKPVKKEVKKPKPKVKVAQKKKPPKKPKPPKVKPKKPKPKKPKIVKKKPKKVYKQKAKKNTKSNKITGNNAKKIAKKKPKKTSGGMAKTRSKADFKHAGKKIAGVKKGPSGGKRGGGNRNVGSARKGKDRASAMGVEGVKNKKSSGVNLSKLGLGVGKVLNKKGPGAIQTNFKSSAGGAGGGMGSGSRTLGMGGGVGKGRSLGLGGSSAGINGFGSGNGGLLSGQGGKGGLGGFGSGRGTGRGSGRGQVNVSVGSAGAPGISGGLTNEEVMLVIRSNLNQIRNCYEKVLQRSPNKSGKMKVKFVVASNGRVQSARVLSNSVRDASMGACVTRVIKKWKFPRPRGGQKVDIKYPFVFNPS
jgi:TonB family protein